MSGGWFGLVKCTVHNVDIVRCLFTLMFLYPYPPKVIIIQVVELFYHFQELGSVAFVSFDIRHFLSPVVIKAVIIISLDGLVLMYLFETVGSRHVVHHTNGIGKEAKHYIEGGSLFLLRMILRGGEQVIATHCCYTKFITALNASAIRIRTGLFEKAPNIPQAAMIEYCRLRSTYESICTLRLALCQTMAGDPYISWSIAALATSVGSHSSRLSRLTYRRRLRQLFLLFFRSCLTPRVPSRLVPALSSLVLPSFRRENSLYILIDEQCFEQEKDYYDYDAHEPDIYMGLSLAYLEHYWTDDIEVSDHCTLLVMGIR